MNVIDPRLKKIGILCAILLLPIVWLAAPSRRPPPQIQGVTFSQPHATGIGLDWQNVYGAILQDLGVKHLRLAAYWSVIEPTDDQFNFSTIDYQMDKAVQHHATVILGIGRKLPRWPECHVPTWARDLSEEKQQERILEMLPVVIERYKGHPALRMWQLENEPLLDFGTCPPEDQLFLRKEEEMVRLHDTSHPILVTDSGELNSWLPAATFGDQLGTTMYRTVFSKRTERLFHYDYVFPAWMYRLKARYVKYLRGKDVLISELQGEPWGDKPFTGMSPQERSESFSVERFAELHRFAKRTQLPEAYWWGVEYWYWEKEVQENDAYWEVARTLFGQSH